ncbi:MAG: 2-amino-4-hydroxy-6-hydroxymethyldihydropteridine diphosphokinase [bacterium]
MAKNDDTERLWHQVFLSIGANQGYPIWQCYQAIYRLEKLPVTEVLERSSFYKTEPFGHEEQDWFTNLVLKIQTKLLPRELLAHTQRVETDLGKKTQYEWGPRIIDIDILLYEDEQIYEPDLKIPHPFLHRRNFVLYPLAEIAPDLRHPQLVKTIKELLLICSDRKEARNIEHIIK